MTAEIGIPRALLYHYYYPRWKTFFQELDCEPVLTPKTNAEILNQGVQLSLDDLCLPVKVYYGHVWDLISRSPDYIFVPRFVSRGKKNEICPKLRGLPDMIRATFNRIPPLLAPDIDYNKKLFPLRRVYYKLGRKLGKNFLEIERAFRKAQQKQNQFEQLMEKGSTPGEAMNRLDSDVNKERDEISKKTFFNSECEKKLKIAVLGHSYILNDSHVSMNLIKHLRDMKVDILTQEMITQKKRYQAARKQNKPTYWYFNWQVMGAAYYIMDKLGQKIDGIIQVASFGCGPDSLIKEIVSLKVKEDQESFLLNIDLDEHSGEAGLITRLEAFVDLLQRRKTL